MSRWVVVEGAGACGGQFTANTMATALEFLGISPMGSAGVPATDPHRKEVAREAGRLTMRLLRDGLRPRRILTMQAFENAIASIAATGGSTNGVLHLLALSREAGVPLKIDDFDRISNRTPLLADLKPGGRFVANDMQRAGGTRLVAKRLLEAKVLHADAFTVSGASIGEEAAKASEAAGQEVIRPLANPISPTGGLVILRGSLAPEGCVVKVAGKSWLAHRGPARVFDREEDAFRAVQERRIAAGDVVVIRYAGPGGGPGCRGGRVSRRRRGR